MRTHHTRMNRARWELQTQARANIGAEDRQIDWRRCRSIIPPDAILPLCKCRVSRRLQMEGGLHIPSISHRLKGSVCTRITFHRPCLRSMTSLVVSHMSLRIFPSPSLELTSVPLARTQYESASWNDPELSDHAAVIHRLSKLCEIAKCRHFSSRNGHVHSGTSLKSIDLGIGSASRMGGAHPIIPTFALLGGHRPYTSSARFTYSLCGGTTIDVEDATKLRGITCRITSLIGGLLCVLVLSSSSIYFWNKCKNAAQMSAKAAACW